MAEEMWNYERGAAVHRGVLDCLVRCFARSGLRGVLGECAIHQEPAWAQQARSGEPVADEAAHLWFVAQLLPSAASDSLAAELLATAAESRALGGHWPPSDG